MSNSNHSSKMNIRWYVAGILLYWVACLLWLFTYTKAEGFLLMRTAGNSFADFFFAYITHVGDGLSAIAICLLWAYRKKWDAVFILFVGYAVSGIAAQVMKRLYAMPRPAPYFQALGNNIRAIDGVELLQSNTSFPSGHTATAFAMATALILISEWWQKKWWLAIVLAAIIGYSRTYLGQHFLIDVWVGSVLGVLSTFIGWLWLRHWKPPFSTLK